jgi:WD40 repeat protein
MEELNDEQCLFSTFNQDGSCFVVGTKKGFRIYNTYPFRCLIKREIDGGISIIEILNRTNIIALVGTGHNPKFSQNKVLLWDDNQSKVICELILRFYIKNIKLKSTKIFIVGETEIIVSTLGSYEKIDSINTCQNKNGIFGISLDPKITIIAYPTVDVGNIIIKNYDEKKGDNYKINEINTHQSEIVALAMNYDGSLVASSSERGTIIKIFRTKDGALIQELRRGTEAAEIYSLAFDLKSQYIACSSNKGTIHIFNVKKEGNQDVKNKKSFFGTLLSFLGIKNEYLNSEWSFAQYRLTYKGKSMVAFNPDNNTSVIVVTQDGKYYQGEFKAKSGGECSTSLTKNYLEMVVEKDDD